MRWVWGLQRLLQTSRLGHLVLDLVLQCQVRVGYISSCISIAGLRRPMLGVIKCAVRIEVDGSSPRGLLQTFHESAYANNLELGLDLYHSSMHSASETQHTRHVLTPPAQHLAMVVISRSAQRQWRCYTAVLPGSILSGSFSESLRKI